MIATALSANLVIGIPLFDEAHAVLAEQIRELLDGPDEQFSALMAALVDSLEVDFRVEEDLMEVIDYPAIRSHREQHARVLAALHCLPPGDVGAGRHAASLLLPWFHAHLATADTALAIAIQVAAKMPAPPAD
jgi:hemerythrin